MIYLLMLHRLEYYYYYFFLIDIIVRYSVQSSPYCMTIYYPRGSLYIEAYTE